jgi:hypothetical protein
VPDIVVAEAGRIIGFLGVHFELPDTGWSERMNDLDSFWADVGIKLMEHVITKWEMRDK